jgi:predicted dehydrogenase
VGKRVGRRAFLGAGAGLTLGIAAGSGAVETDGPVRVGVIGVGNRGTHLLRLLLRLGVRVPAVCDINSEVAERAVRLIEEAGQPRPELYTRDEIHYKELLTRDDLDAVIIATYWQWHAPMAVDGMRAGKYVGVEVPAALTFEECWALVDTYEETKVPCMMLENWSFRRDNLALLRMVREGLFGDIVHCHCAHSHDCIDHWFFDPQGNMRWGGEFLVKRNCDQYPTHSEGPVLSWMDINCGDAYATITSTASDSKSINDYFTRKFGADHPNAKRVYKQGDIVTSVVRTHKGKTLVINYDMQLPRPYDNRWMLQGTQGIYNEQRTALYVEDRSPDYHQWEPFKPYEEEFLHPWWDITEEERKLGHGGTDYVELKLFIQAVRDKTQTPIDVYDSATMSSIIPLSEASIAQGSAPVECPDYTRGAWKTRKPTFGVV